MSIEVPRGMTRGSFRPNENNRGVRVRTRNLTVSLYEGDWDMLLWMEEYFGTNKSDVIRTAIRTLAVHTQAIDKTGKG